jgi:hypothetical protein
MKFQKTCSEIAEDFEVPVVVLKFCMPVDNCSVLHISICSLAIKRHVCTFTYMSVCTYMNRESCE